MSFFGNVQDGYESNPWRSRTHDRLKFQAYYGWKECQRLGIEYKPEPLQRSNIYVRNSIKGREDLGYTLDAGLTPVFDHATKYAYPLGMSDADKRKFRAAKRKEAKKASAMQSSVGY